MGNTVAVGGERVSALLKKRLIRTAHALLRALNLEETALEIFLLSGKNMLLLKKKFPPHIVRSHGRRRAVAAQAATAENPVDVLAFPEREGFPHPENPRRHLGEVYLNREIAKRDFRASVLLLIHGTLHLLGYLHDTDRGAKTMERHEKMLWHHISSSD